MRDETLRLRIDAHGAYGGVAVERIGAAAELLADRVLEQPVDENDVASGEFFSAAHLLLHHLAAMDDELEIEIAHRDAGLALAGRGLAHVAQPAAEFEIRALDRVLQQRAVDLFRHRIDECGVALEFCEAKRRPQPLHHRIHEIGDDVLRMVEFDRREEVGVAGDVGNREIGSFSLRKHAALQRYRRPAIAPRPEFGTRCRPRSRARRSPWGQTNIFAFMGKMVGVAGFEPTTPSPPD